MIDRRVIEPDVIVMGGERDVFASQRRVAAAEDADDVARGKCDRRISKSEGAADAARSDPGQK